MKNFKTISLLCFFGHLFFFPNIFYAEVSKAQEEMLKTLPADQRDSIMKKMDKSNALQKEIEEVFEKERTLIEKPEIENTEDEELICSECIYGYEFFKYSPSTFVQTSSSPVPSDYVLGPGDKLTINLYGSTNRKVDSFISREGTVLIPTLGPVTLVGMQYNEAISFVKEKVYFEF